MKKFHSNTQGSALGGSAPGGFTLIETLIYIGLLGLIMAATLASSYELLRSSSTTSGKTTTQEEGVFIERKLEWALADMSEAPTQSGTGCNQGLSINKEGYNNNPIEFRRNAINSVVEMREGGAGSFIQISTSNVSVGCFTVSSIAPVGSSPPGIVVALTIGGLPFGITKYVRQ